MANDFDFEAFQAKQAKRRKLFETPIEQWTDADLIERLTEDYAESEIPPCRVCGGPLSIQRIGGGGPTIWACSGMKPDNERKDGESLYQPDRRPADKHYEQSRWEDRRQGGDDSVMELLRRYRRATGGVHPTHQPKENGNG